MYNCHHYYRIGLIIRKLKSPRILLQPLQIINQPLPHRTQLLKGAPHLIVQGLLVILLNLETLSQQLYLQLPFACGAGLREAVSSYGLVELAFGELARAAVPGLARLTALTAVYYWTSLEFPAGLGGQKVTGHHSF